VLLGVRVYYMFYGSMLESKVAFEEKVEDLCRELGARGKPRSAVALFLFFFNTHIYLFGFSLRYVVLCSKIHKS